MTAFVLDPRLEHDSVFICDGPLSQLRLSRNAAFPWLILVPRRADVAEFIDLNDADQIVMWEEIRTASHIMKELYAPKKLNVANIGNIVAQLHIHVIARYEADQAWPGPVWNSGVSQIYDDALLHETVGLLRNAWERART